MVKLLFRLGLVTEKPLAHSTALENGSDLHENERQKIQHNRATVGLLKNKTNKKKEEC